MANTFAVLFGKRGVKGGFRKMKTALKFAQRKANKMGKAVDIDRILSTGSQRTVKVVRPKR